VHLRLWAPRRRRVEVVLETGPTLQPERQGRPAPLEAEEGGYFSGSLLEATDGTRYRYRLDGAEMYPDPASRYQPEGPHGPSQVVDPSQFRWSDSNWRGAPLQGQVLYEMHVGTFTREGTWEAAGR